MRRVVVAIVLLGLVPTMYAQEGRRGAAPYVRLNVAPETVKGAPYSADVVSESIQTLSDGNRIVHQTTSRVYRDGEGRTRREEDRPSGPPAITISDPVSGNFWNLDVDGRTARRSASMPLVYNGTVNRNGELQRLNVLINGQLSSFLTSAGDAFVVGRANEQTVEEKLTARTIEGVRVEGTRRTMTIPARAIGNERAIVATSEEWTSPELKALILSETSDPRTGSSTYKLVNVRRAEPAASLFQVPADYTVIETLAPGGRGRAGQR